MSVSLGSLTEDILPAINRMGNIFLLCLSQRKKVYLTGKKRWKSGYIGSFVGMNLRSYCLVRNF